MGAESSGSVSSAESINRWVEQIGYIAIYFADIERVVYEDLVRVSKDCIANFIYDLSLLQKIRLMREMISKYDLNEVRVMLRLLDKVAELSRKRNMIVHNPLAMDVYTNDQCEFVAVESIRFLKNKDKVEKLLYEDVVSLRIDAEKLALELHDVSRELRGSR